MQKRVAKDAWEFHFWGFIGEEDSTIFNFKKQATTSLVAQWYLSPLSTCWMKWSGFNPRISQVFL